MCGIIVFSGLSTGSTWSHLADALEQGIALLGHRGPDDSGLHIDKTADTGLGHTRLSIIDLSPLGHQPMLSDDGQLALVFNGEIYNFRELRKKLEAKGHVFRGHSDTEVLLNLYLDQGEAMLPRLNGIFAFALWDGHKGALLVARDGLGVKPLY
ncbi:MAG: hypothetical protein H6963_13365 [Chromatiaceae bacterium]|nr:hypothetical protein [Chromatiaceae bacterium]